MAHFFKKGKPKKTTNSFSQQVFAANEANQIVIVKEALETIEYHFKDIVTFIGAPGARKSTLGSAVYSLMRNEIAELFERSDSAFSFTEGIWCVNRKEKQLKAGCDSFDVLDVQGVDHKNISHYFAMIAFILSKVMVVCSADARLDLTIFPVLNTIATAMSLLQEKGVAFSIPVIYLPCKVGGWKVDEDTMIGESEIPHAVKELFPVLGEADIRVYVQFPDVGREQNPLLNEGFMNAVRCQIEEWKMIRSMTPIVERVEYAKIIIRAINANSPQMVYEANREFFGKKLKDLYASLHAQMQEQMRNDHRGREVTSSLMKYEDFLLYKEKSFEEEFERVSKQWAYYQAGFDSMLREYNCVIKVGDLVKDIFEFQIGLFHRDIRINEMNKHKLSVLS